MTRFHVRIIGGSCGNKMYIVADHIHEVLQKAGYECKVSAQSIWETMSMPPAVDLILQLLPAFSPGEGDCPIILIKPLLKDLNDNQTIQKIMDAMAAQYQAGGA